MDFISSLYLPSPSQILLKRKIYCTFIFFLTFSAEPTAPKDVRLVLSEKKNLLLEIKSPEFWNGPPSKYRIRWEPKDRRRGSSGYRDIDIASTWTPKQKWTTTNVTLEPGLQYKVFVSAQNSISTGVSFWGPEYANEVTTIPLGEFVSGNILFFRRIIKHSRSSSFMTSLSFFFVFESWNLSP